ncbi:polymorphic toxin-type HINT domain-containing protein [Streptomyces sp. AN091965]|uniref:polymorphic toxin-type HINT domain-containing protein n=1 Tax=Streptomyces sp. AN091965 TaxID=2927803 RepID=UPI001F60A320|nr:polymorphic toxin-type HINT domain-containing protein [Streptomyces sp. AN091965]MCI3933951.1 sugar-binding protein [Streptomyces sp. AN091965]
MVGTLLQAAATSTATADSGGRPGLPSAEKPVAGRDGAKAEPRKTDPGPTTPSRKPKAAWPRPGSAVVTVPDAAPKAAGAPKRAKGLPLSVGAPKAAAARSTSRSATKPGPAARGGVEARVLSRKAAERAGVKGLLFTLESGDRKADKAGTVQTKVDYSSFAEAFGGGYASRLTLVELPGCALDAPSKDKCRTGKPVRTVNDTEKQTLTASAVTLRSSGPTVLAAVAEEGGKNSDYKATSLSPSAKWDTDLRTGDFSWSYDMPVPEVPGDLKPNVGLSYSSGSMDGRTGNTNNQASWVGDGFDLWPGYIERRYKGCADDGQKNADGNKPGDQCWDYDNAFITFNGKGGELVPIGDDEFKFQQDDGSRIKKLASANRGNGDNDGEYWRLTDPEGVRYYFGYNRLPGWKDGKAATNSAWTVPVFGNDSGEPCHKDSFAESWCQQAWRWNLDYVVDPRGNAIAYYYDEEKNSYGRNLKAEDDTPYTRGGSLDHIEYGLKSSSMYSGKPLAKVDFTTSERCIVDSKTDCKDIEKDAYYWYDTPWDLNCKAGSKCDKGRLSPSFFTRKRLTGVTTQVLKGDTYSKVDSWKLRHRWGKADVDYQLLLGSVERTGHTAEPAVTLPRTTFSYTQLENRLDKIGDGYAPFIKGRLSTIADESGGQVDVNYSAPACKWGALPTPQSNTTRCFPQYIGGDSGDDPEKQWFNKYVVTSTTTTDRTGGAPDAVTTYEYLGDAAWHYDDDDGLTKKKFKTWSQWRGYGHVRVKSGGQGGGGALKTQQDSYFLRGMDGDRKEPSGGTKSVDVALGDDEGDPITDHESAAGVEYKTVAYSGPGGKALSKTVNRPWHHQTAKKVRDWGTVTANLTGVSHSKTWTSLDDGAGKDWRTTSVATEYDTVAGRPVQVDDRGDSTTASDNQCTRTTYATNTDKNILMLPSRVETVTGACADKPDRAKDVVSDVRTAYDGGAYGEAPTKGDATATATLKKHDGSKATYLESGATFDDYGRQLTATDLTADVTVTGSGDPVRSVRKDGRTITTSYSPATGFAAKVTETTPPAKAADPDSAQTSVTELEPLRGQPSATVDTNGKRTELSYDALGRSSKVWLPDRRTSQTPSHEFTYFVDEGKPVAVRTQTLNNNGGQIPSYTIYDGFLRERQTQAVGPDGGRILSDTFYDERGLPAKTFAPYYTEGNPNRDLFKPDNALSVESQIRTTYDGLGRPVELRQIAGNGDGGKVLATTKTIYGGDRTTVIPPEGDTATTTLIDARGRTTELHQHHKRSGDAEFDTTKYTYSPRGELTKVTDPAGNTWSYGYDQMGRQTSTDDPDKGKTTTTYDDRGQVTKTEDARETVLAHVYDNLGRATELREGSPTGELRAKWVYDTIDGAKGQLAESTRYVDGAAYTSKVTMLDSLYRPMKSAVVIPEKEGALAGTYQTGTQYLTSGLVGGVSYSKAGSLPGGSYNTTYDKETLRPLSVLGDGLKADTSYSLTGKPLQYTLGASGGKKIWATNTYEWGTQRLATSRVDREDQPGVDQHDTYRYDDAGNILSVSDVSRTGTDTQCFNYDYLRRLTEAWTQGDKTCGTTPAGDKVGGPAPYWHSYTYDKAGNRLTETLHDTSGATGDNAKDTQRTYDYPKPGAPQPHTLTSVTTQQPGGTATKDSYDYDPTGNTTTRTLRGDTQKLTWDAEGHLAKVTEPDTRGNRKAKTKTTEYLYDTDGNRLIARTPTETTLYLGHTEVTLPKGASKAKATRYTPLGGGHEAVTADDGTVTFTTADHQGTGQLSITAADLKLNQRRTLPFGGPRGEQPKAWPGTKTFVGGTDDTASTGLIHLGAREYDPTTGRFISVDPIMDLTDPQQMNGYAYGNNSPVVYADPSGKFSISNIIGGVGKTIKKMANRVVSYLNADSNASRSFGGGGGGGSRNIGGGYWGGSGSTSNALYTGGGGGPMAQTGFSLPGNPFGRMNDAIFPHLRSFFSGGGAKDVPKMMLPDLHSWKTCGTHPGVTVECAETGMDLIPWGKALKPFKGALKGLKKAEKGEEAAGKARQGIPSGCKCFLAGTDVLMADGSTKNIEDVELGDKVQATDPETGETSEREVTATIVTDDDKQFTELTITTPDGPEKLTATYEHPFWSVGQKDWIEAGDLKPGTTLRTDDGRTVTVAATRQYQDHQRTYNLTIEGLHTYYVLAGATPVLVHNSGPCKEVVLDSFSSFEKARNKALDLLGEIDPTTRQPYIGRLEAAPTTYGKVVGFTTRVNGEFKRFRMDYDPEKGPHINVEVGKGDSARKWAVPWNGTEDDFARMIGGNS